jgi:hypothetical protein
MLFTSKFENSIIEVYGTYENPLIKKSDVFNLLQLDNESDDQLFFTEDDIYELYFKSRNIMVKTFILWLKDVIKQELKKQLQEKEKELDKYKDLKYDEVEKTGCVYIITTDKPGIYKCGRTKILKSRINSMQANCVDDIQVLFEYHTSNDVLLESTVHYVLDRYRSNSNREHFNCDIEHIKNVITFSGKILDTLKSSYQNISHSEILSKLDFTIPEITVTEKKLKECKKNKKANNQDDKTDGTILNFNELFGIYETYDDTHFIYVESLERKRRDKSNKHLKEIFPSPIDLMKYCKTHFKVRIKTGKNIILGYSERSQLSDIDEYDDEDF